MPALSIAMLLQIELSRSKIHPGKKISPAGSQRAMERLAFTPGYQADMQQNYILTVLA